MESFSLWLETKEPKITGYFVSHNTDHTYNRSKIFPTYHEAWEEKKRLAKTNTPSIISVAFQDGTSRHLDNSSWFIKKSGQTQHDYQIDRTKRGKTLHAYNGKNIPEYKANSILYRLKNELRPGNMPENTGELIGNEFWQKVNSALDIAVKEQNLAHIARLRDFIEENYGQTRVGEICVELIDQTMKQFGFDF